MCARISASRENSNSTLKAILPASTIGASPAFGRTCHRSAWRTDAWITRHPTRPVTSHFSGRIGHPLVRQLCQISWRQRELELGSELSMRETRRPGLDSSTVSADRGSSRLALSSPWCYRLPATLLRPLIARRCLEQHLREWTTRLRMASARDPIQDARNSRAGWCSSGNSTKHPELHLRS